MKHGKRTAIAVFGGVAVMSGLFAPTASAAIPPSFAVVSVNGGDAAPDEARMKCQVVLRSDGPEGFTYGISDIDFRGTADLASGARGTLKAAHYFEGGLPNTYTYTIPGPVRASGRRITSLTSGK